MIFSSTIFNTNKTLSDRINHFFCALERRFNFETVYTDRLNGRSLDLACRVDSADLVLIYAGVHGHQLLRDSVRLNRRTKVVYLLTGPHSFDRSLLDPVVKRASLVLCTEKAIMLQRFPHHNGRIRHFPYYFAPHERYAELDVDGPRTMQCLFTGHANNKIYPLRSFILKQLEHDRRLQGVMVRARHPRWGRKDGPLKPYEIEPVLNQTYALALNKYFCSVATGSVYRYVLAKYFEIPAAGALLLAERTADSDSVGLVPWKHYVAIDRKNVVAQITECLQRPQQFETIRRAGCDYVRTHHSVRNRVAQLEEMLDEL